MNERCCVLVHCSDPKSIVSDGSLVRMLVSERTTGISLASRRASGEHASWLTSFGFFCFRGILVACGESPLCLFSITLQGRCGRVRGSVCYDEKVLHPALGLLALCYVSQTCYRWSLQRFACRFTPEKRVHGAENWGQSRGTIPSCVDLKASHVALRCKTTLLVER